MTESSSSTPVDADDTKPAADAKKDPRNTDHPAGDEQANANVEDEPAG